MARKSRLTRVASTIGGTLGKAQRKARQVVEARGLVERELRDIAKQINVLKRQVEVASKRFRRAIS